jgi:hypothetical protein
MSWITDLKFALNKKDYFIYLLLVFFIYWTFSNTFTQNNLVYLIPTLFIMWFILQNSIDTSFASMQRQNDKLEAININEYESLNKDIETIDIFLEIKDLVLINRLKLAETIKRTNNFFYLYDFVFNEPIDKTQFYELALNESKAALNSLMSFHIDLDTLPKDDYNGIAFVTDDMIKSAVEKLKKRFQLFLNKMEVHINKKWIEGDINIYSKPVYPDDPSPSILDDTQYSANYNLY